MREAPTPRPAGQGRAINRAILQRLKRMSRLENLAARRQLQLLAVTRREVIRAMGAAPSGSFRAFHLGELLAAIDRAILQGRPAAVNLAAIDAQAAFGLGQQHVDAVLRIAGVGETLTDVSAETLQAVLDVTRDQVRAVWSELGTTLKADVRRATLGLIDPVEAMTAVTRAIRNAKSFGTAATRAEIVARTEINRTFALATQSRLQQAGDRLGPALKKTWLAVDDARTRDAHRRAGRDYGPHGDPGPIPIDEPFVVDGEDLMFPLDPRGSPANTIACRCRAVPFVEDLVELV